MKISGVRPVPADPELWSKQSKNSVAYEFGWTHYADKPYKCYRCKADAAFTAEEQKVAFEVKKRHIAYRRTLCRACHDERHKLVADERNLRGRWLGYREQLARDKHSLAEWRRLLCELPYYGVRRDSARLKVLDKLLALEV
jgi:hypothetical protein